jgi:hypothetical protein
MGFTIKYLFICKICWWLEPISKCEWGFCYVVSLEGVSPLLVFGALCFVL